MDIDVLLPGFPGKADRGFLGWCNVLALKLKGSVILVDTAAFLDRPMLLASMAAKGIDPKAVSKIMLTHLHCDHCLNTDVFPNAEIFIGAKEWEYASSGMSQKKNDPFVPVTCLPYIESRKPKLVEEGYYLADGLKIVELPGHTPGCIGLLCENEGLLIAGDAMKNARDFTFNDPGMCFDTVENGLASLARAAKLADKIIPGHDSPFSIAGGKAVRPIEPKVVITDFTDWTNQGGTAHYIPGR
jgi:glyoxylase-like metal-dependent hydrolase (beta-lactamase superfamily II)